jgi:predicted ATPase
VVARLRAQFGPTFIETAGFGYRLGARVASDRARILETAATVEVEPEGIDIDIESQVEDALHRWRGEPWVDIMIEEVEPDRARLDAARVSLLRARARTLTGRHRYAEAAETFDEVMAADGCTDRDWFELARCLAALGRRADALARIRKARRRQSTRGLTISNELATLEAALLDGSWNDVSAHQRTDRSSPMFGRREQLERASEVIDERRLVTLVGPGGVGKTRLALELMERRPELSPVFVDLVPVRDGRFVADAVAGAVHADIEAAGSVIEAIIAELRVRPRLVVLDNCEQVADAAAHLVTTLTSRCVDTNVLATSRQGLGVDGEFVLELRPLETGAQGAGVDLFFQRAAESGIDLDPTEWRTTVAELCRRIDGLPLAIELAARRATMLTPDEIIAGLVDRFDLLRSAGPGHRHSALWTTLLWSWDLLDAGEQQVLCRLAAFASGVDVVELGAAVDLEQWSALDVVQRLRSKSLVSVDSGPNRPSRAHLLESVRILAIEQAREQATWGSCRSLHLRWVDDFTTRIVGPHGHDDRQVADPLARLDREGNEIRAAIEWTEDDPARALAVCARLVNWWRGRDMAAYAIERFEELLGASVTDDAEVRGEALTTLVLMRRIAGFAPTRTSELADDARRLIDDIADEAVRDRLELRYYEAAFDVDDATLPVRIRAIIDRTRARGERVDTLATHLLSAWFVAKDPAHAPSVAEEYFSLSQPGTLARQAHAWEQRGLAALATGDLQRAQHFLGGALGRFEDIGQRFCSVHGCESVAWWLALQGQHDRSRAILAAAEGLRAKHHRYRSGFEEPAVDATIDLLGERPSPDPHALLDATIEAALAHIGSANHPATPE